MDYNRMFPVLDFLEEYRTNPKTGNKLGQNNPVVFSFLEFKKSSPSVKQIFRSNLDLEEMLGILDNATIGPKGQSKKVCCSEHLVSEPKNRPGTKYTVDATTLDIQAYRNWLKGIIGKSELVLKSNGELCYRDKTTKLYLKSRPFLILKYLTSKPVRTNFTVGEIKTYILRFDRGEIVKDKQVYGAMESLKTTILNLTNNKAPWGKFKNGVISLEL